MDSQLIKEEHNWTVREDFQVILRLNCNLQLPEGKDVICEWNRTLAENVISEMKEVGEKIRNVFRALPNIREKSKFRVRSGEYCVKTQPLGENHIIISCEVKWTQGNPELPELSRFTQIWNFEEQTMLPSKEIARRWNKEKKKKIKKNSSKQDQTNRTGLDALTG